MIDLFGWLILHTADPWSLLVAAVANGLPLHPVDQIVNVSWTGGLAVEFEPGTA
jgi:hypothetical protein